MAIERDVLIGFSYYWRMPQTYRPATNWRETRRATTAVHVVLPAGCCQVFKEPLPCPWAGLSRVQGVRQHPGTYAPADRSLETAAR